MRELETAYAEISAGTEKDIRLELSSYLLLAAMVSFIVEMVLVNSKYRTIP
jgi:hypothetical protein